jgi:hypothetical protein
VPSDQHGGTNTDEGIHGNRDSRNLDRELQCADRAGLGDLRPEGAEAVREGLINHEDNG